MSERLPNNRKVLLSGATGLVGAQILQLLLADPTVSEIHVLSRRALDIRHAKVLVHVVDFRQLPVLPPLDEVYLALGTTIQVAGSQEAFRAVDMEANLAVARAGFASGARRVALVSAVGADALSSVFYLRIKGELEDALRKLDLAALVIAQPSLLLGNRDALKQAPRFGEKISTPIMKLLAPLLPKRYRPIHVATVAHALVKTLPAAHGTVILQWADMTQIAS